VNASFNHINKDVLRDILKQMLPFERSRFGT